MAGALSAGGRGRNWLPPIFALRNDSLETRVAVSAEAGLPL